MEKKTSEQSHRQSNNNRSGERGSLTRTTSHPLFSPFSKQQLSSSSSPPYFALCIFCCIPSVPDPEFILLQIELDTLDPTAEWQSLPHRFFSSVSSVPYQSPKIHSPIHYNGGFWANHAWPGKKLIVFFFFLITLRFRTSPIDLERIVLQLDLIPNYNR